MTAFAREKEAWGDGGGAARGEEAGQAHCPFATRARSTCMHGPAIVEEWEEASICGVRVGQDRFGYGGGCEW